MYLDTTLTTRVLPPDDRPTYNAMNERHDHDATSGVVTQRRSIFLQSIENRALQHGQTLEAALAAERERAVQRPAELSEDCLLPDEGEQLLLSPNVTTVDGVVRIAPGKTPSDFEAAAIYHVRECSFCASLLSLMQPRIEEREQFLKKVREEARRRGGQSTIPIDAHSRDVKGWARIRASIPILAPLLIAVYAIYKSPSVAAFPLEETFLASWPIVVIAGAIAAALAWLPFGGTKSTLFQLPSSAARRFPRAIIAMSFSATIAMLLFGGANAYHTDQKVLDSQRLMVADTAVNWIRNEQFEMPIPEKSMRVRCDTNRAGERSLVCEAIEPIVPVPGIVVASMGQDSADVYWSLRGERHRELLMERARVVLAPNGRKALESAAGDILPSKSEQIADYEVGTAVIGVKGPGAQRVLDALHANQDAAALKVVVLK